MVMDNRHYALGRAEILACLRSYVGITNADGAADGSTLIDSNLIGENDYITNKLILIGSNNARLETSGAIAFAPASGTITVVTPFSAQILSGTPFWILNFSAGDITLNLLNALIAAILVTSETGGEHTTTDNAEHDIYINFAPAGVFEPLKVMIDFTNQLAASIVVIRTYYRIRAGGDLILKDEVTFAGLISPELINVELEPNRFGIQVTMQRTAGVDIAYDWEVLYRV